MKSLAVKYRPQTFDEVCGQTVTTRILNKVLEKQSFKNAYLFAGPSGCGYNQGGFLSDKEISEPFRFSSFRV